MEEEKKSKLTNKNIRWISGLIAVIVVVFILAGALGVIPSFGKKDKADNSQETISEVETDKGTETGIPYAEYVDEDPFFTEHSGEKEYEDTYEEEFNVYEHHYDDDKNITYNSYEDVLNNVPEYTGDQFVAINQSKSFFTKEDIEDRQYINYSELDSLGRAGVAWGIVGPETRNTADRQKDLSVVTPSGWNQVDVESKYGILLQPEDYPFMFARCHLIAYSLGGGEIEKRDIVTGTYAFNNTMLLFEREVLDLIDIVGDTVLYRVTPVYKGDELICRGVLIEAYDVESEGRFVNMCVFVHNVQPGFEINYNTGKETRVS